MPDIGAALRGRTFGIPNGILLLAVAAGIYWFFIRGKTGAKATPQAAAAGSATETGYGLGYAQGLQAAQANQPQPQPTPAPGPQVSGPLPPAKVGPPGDTPCNPSDWKPSGSGYSYTGPGNFIKGGQVYLPLQFSQSQALGGQAVFFFAPCYPVPVGPGLSAGTSLYIPQPAGSAQTGQGGPSPRKHAIGSRSVWLHHDAHPLIGAPVKYAHYVRVGGPRTARAHQANVNHVAQQAGVHPARVAMLNPVPTGLIRIA